MRRLMMLPAPTLPVAALGIPAAHAGSTSSRFHVYAVKFGLTITDLAATWAPYLTMVEGVKLTVQSFTTEVEILSCRAA